MSEAGKDEPKVRLDASGLKCPLPVLKARKAIKEIAVGEIIEVISTDPASPLDIKHFCGSSGHHLLSESEQAGRFVFNIRKGA